MMVVDGSQGEGGGQVLRTCLSLSALTGRPFRLENIRANRSKPGLRPQHLTAVRAVAACCDARLAGASLDSRALTFEPQSAPRGGHYTFDVTSAAKGGSAGAVTLIWQALVWPLLFADAPATVTLRGGTHVPFSPPFHYLAHVAQPAFARLGATVRLTLNAWGWFPVGGGEITAVVHPLSQLAAHAFAPEPQMRVAGVAAVTNLPAHIPQRMARRAHNLLEALGRTPAVEPVRASGAGPGAGIVLWVPGGGFTALGRKGLPADKVAEAAVADYRAFVENSVAVDRHLADQLLLPLALASGTSSFTTQAITSHTLTNAALLRDWLGVTLHVEGQAGQRGAVSLTGIALQRRHA